MGPAEQLSTSSFSEKMSAAHRQPLMRGFLADPGEAAVPRAMTDFCEWEGQGDGAVSAALCVKITANSVEVAEAA